MKIPKNIIVATVMVVMVVMVDRTGQDRTGQKTLAKDEFNPEIKEISSLFFRNEGQLVKLCS